MYGAQTQGVETRGYNLFENDVEMYGAQTQIRMRTEKTGLRMM